MIGNKSLIWASLAILILSASPSRAADSVTKAVGFIATADEAPKIFNDGDVIATRGILSPAPWKVYHISSKKNGWDAILLRMLSTTRAHDRKEAQAACNFANGAIGGDHFGLPTVYAGIIAYRLGLVEPVKYGREIVSQAAGIVRIRSIPPALWLEEGPEKVLDGPAREAFIKDTGTIQLGEGNPQVIDYARSLQHLTRRVAELKAAGDKAKAQYEDFSAFKAELEKGLPVYCMAGKWTLPPKAKPDAS